MLQFLSLLFVAGQRPSISFTETTKVIHGPYRLLLTVSSVGAGDFKFSKSTSGQILIDGRSRSGAFMAKPTTKIEKIEVFFKGRRLRLNPTLWKYFFEPHVSRRDLLDNPDALKTSLESGNLKAILLCGDGAAGYELTLVFRPDGRSSGSTRAF